jgi:phospholipase/lecithinase/hemolysin
LNSQALTSRYNITNTKVFNLAYGGATIDSNLVTPYLPTVQSVVTQVGLFRKYLAKKPEGAKWKSSNSLFAFWIGINDVGNSWYWVCPLRIAMRPKDSAFLQANTTQAAFHETLMTRLFGQVEELYQSGARSFLFLTVPPTDRAPLLIQSGPDAVSGIKAALADYNAQLNASIAKFQKKHKDLDQVVVFDTVPVFNTLLDNADTFGFVNVTGYSEAYQNGTPNQTTQVAGYAPVSSYFWLNSLHPIFTVHE